MPLQRYWIIFLSLIVLSICFRFLYDDNILHQFHTLSCAGDLAMGALGAWLIVESDRFRGFVVQLNKYLIIVAHLLFLGFYFYLDELNNISLFFRICDRTILSILIGFIILEQCYSKHSFYKMFSFPVISKLGVISYGLYYLHFVGILIAINITKILKINTEIWQVMVIQTILALLITILISYLSYKFFESPFLKLKEKFSLIHK